MAFLIVQAQQPSESHLLPKRNSVYCDTVFRFLLCIHVTVISSDATEWL